MKEVGTSEILPCWAGDAAMCCACWGCCFLCELADTACNQCQAWAPMPPIADRTPMLWVNGVLVRLCGSRCAGWSHEILCAVRAQRLIATATTITAATTMTYDGNNDALAVMATSRRHQWSCEPDPGGALLRRGAAAVLKRRPRPALHPLPGAVRPPPRHALLPA